jgi:hypothetical protein
MIRTLPVLVAALLAAPSGWTSGPAAQVPAPGQVTPPRGVGPAAATATGTGVIRGAVVAMDTGTPLRRVQVRAYSNSPDARGTRTTSTDDQGRFELRELAAGRYTISASKGGFVTLQFGQRRPSERGTPVDLADGQVVEKVAIALPRGSVITGRIVDDAGEPAAGVQVQVLRYSFAPGGRRLMPMGMSDRTDDTGAFRVYGLSPGDYYVSATGTNMGQMMMPDARLATGDSEQGFAPTYYPGTPSVADAERLTLGVGQELSGITFGLTPTRLSRVSGRVIGWTSARGMGFVMAMPEDTTTWTGPTGPPGQIQPEGDFEMRGLAPGRYTLRVQPRGPRDSEDLVGLAAITVAGTDLSGVTITLQPPGTMTGRIEFEGGVPSTVRASQVRLSVIPADGRGGPMMMMSGPPEVGDDFTFRVRGATGGVFVRPNGPPGWHLKAVVVDDDDVTDAPVSLAPGANLQGVRVLLTQSAGTVSGSIRDDRGNVVVDGTVLLFPEDDAHWAFASRFIRTTRPDTEGRFELSALPPAGYRIVALPSIEDGQMFDPDFLGGLRDRAERLPLNQGETKAIELRLRP